MKSIRQINLAKSAYRASEKVRKIGKILTIISFLVLGLFLILYTASFSLISYLSVKYNRTQNNINELTNAINEKKVLEAIKTASFKKLNTIDKIMAAQLPYQLLFKDIFDFIASTPIEVKNLNLDENGTISMVMIASTSAALDEFVESLIAKDELEDKYKNINATSIVRESEGAYNMGITFITNRKKFNEE